MPEGEGFEGARPNSEDIESGVEHRQGREPTTRTENVANALKDLRKRPEEKADPIREGNVLIQAAILDAIQDSDEQGTDEEIAQLRRLDSALLEIAYDNAGDLDLQTMNQLATNFRGQRDFWDKPPIDTDASTAKANRKVYDDILIEIYDKLPLPEGPLKESPRYEFVDIDKITEHLKKPKGESLTLADAKEFFEEINEDLSAAQKLNPHWARQLIIVNEARGFAMKNLDKKGYEKPIVILNKDDDKVEKCELFEEGKSYPPKTKDGSRQFILDLNGDYVKDVYGIEDLKQSAGDADSGIDKLIAGGEEELTIEENRGISVFLARLKENTDTGSMDEETYNKNIKRFGIFLNLTLHDTGAIELNESPTF